MKTIYDQLLEDIKYVEEEFIAYGIHIEDYLKLYKAFKQLENLKNKIVESTDEDGVPERKTTKKTRKIFRMGQKI